MTTRRDTLLATGLRAPDLFPASSFYERLAAAGVASHVAQPAPIARSTASGQLLRGATVHPFDANDDGLVALGAALGREERAYGLIYLAEVDALMHDDRPGRRAGGRGVRRVAHDDRARGPRWRVSAPARSCC